MKSIRTIAALVAVLGLSSFAQAGLFKRGGDCGASKCCDCAPTFQPTCCKPTIVRPCHRNVYNYQRTCAKATGCDAGCGPANSCCPSGAGNGCVNGAGNCAAPCANGAGCDNGAGTCTGGNACVGAGAGNCAAPCGNGCVNGAGNCAAPCGNGNACAGANNCAAPCGAGNGCAGNGCAGDGCVGDSCCTTTCQDACQIAQLIYESQTACYARQRRAAIAKLGNKYDCVCNPEIMSAFIYALNDADERVRTKAADEIGDQLRKNKCCCSQCVVEALTVSLADCDRGVRRQAEQALRQCGYDIVDPCCEVACDTGCAGNAGCVGNGCAPAPASAEPAPAATPAPAPPAEPKAYFPKRINDENARPVSAKKKSLSNLFGLVR